MKNKFFNAKLYFEGIKQLKLVGIMSAVFLSLFSILVPVAYFIDAMYTDENGVLRFGQSVIKLANACGANYLLYLFIVPVMCLTLFSFLTKRNACDFYHAVPVKRESLYLSFYAAIMTWVIGILTLTALLSVITCAVLPGVSMLASSILAFYFKILAACILVSGGFMIAIGLTGTTFTNLLVAMIVLFFPRVFILMATLMINSSVPYVNMSQNGLLLNFHNNLLISTFTDLLIPSYRGELTPILYSTILGLIYAAIGCVIFARRKSEHAGNAAINSKLQLIFRLTVAFAICLLPCYNIYEAIISKHTLSLLEIFFLFVVYVVAVFAYFLYELITTKKLKNLLKAAPGLLILLAVNVLFIAGISLGSFIIKNTIPTADKINYFLIDKADEFYASDTAYFDSISSNIKIDDKEAIEEIDKILLNTKALYEDKDYVINYNMFRTINVSINSGLTTKSYALLINDADYSKLLEHLKNNEKYRELFTNLPKSGTNYTSASIYGLSEEDANLLYDTACEDIANMSFEDAYKYLYKDRYESNIIEWLQCTTVYNSNVYTYDIAISDKLPNAYKFYLSKTNEINDSGKLLDILNDWEGNSHAYNAPDFESFAYFSEAITIDADYNYCGIYFTGRNVGEMEVYEKPTAAQLEYLKELSKHVTLVDESTDISNAVIATIRYDFYYELEDQIDMYGIMSKSTDYDAYFVIDEEGVELIKKLSEEQENIEEYGDYEIY